MNLALKPCLPPRWARGGHKQTILAHLLPSPALRLHGERFRIPLTDGDQLVATFYEGTSSVLLLAFHGLNGSCQSSYMQRTARLALAQNHSVLLINHRGCGYGEGLAKKPYHSGRGEDVSSVVGWARKKWPQKKIVALGFSLGANALLNLVTGLRGVYQPDGAIAVNGPTDLKSCSQLLQTGLNRIYDLNFFLATRREIIRKRDYDGDGTEVRLPWIANLRDIDELYTAPAGGFKNAEDYYSTCSTFDHLAQIKTPTLILMSKDDPFIPWQPYLNAQGNPNVILHLEETGGHMGYLHRGQKAYGYDRWLDYALDQMLTTMTKEML